MAEEGFGGIGEYVKKHPYLVGGLAIGGIFLFFLISRSGGGGASGGTDLSSLYSAELQAQAQQSQTDAALTAQSNQLGAQLQATQIGAQTQVTTAQLEAQYGLATTTVQAQAAQNLAAIQANGADTLASLQAGVDVAGINAQQDVQNNAIAAQLAQNAQDQATQQIAIAANLEGLKNNNATAADLAWIGANENSQIAAMTAGVETQIAGLQASVAANTNATQVALGQISGNVAINQSNNSLQASLAQTNANVSMAKISAGAQKTSGILGLIGGIAGALL